MINSKKDIYELLEARQKALQKAIKTFYPSQPILRNCCHRASDGNSLYLDSPTSEVPAPEVNESAMTARFCITSLSKDRAGDIVIPRGCVPHLLNYKKNPRVFFSHKSTDLPLGSARKESGDLDMDIFDNDIYSTCHFHGQTPESELIFTLVARKELQSASIGFLPVKAAIIRPEKEAERPETDEDGDDMIYFKDGCDWWPSLKFHEWDLTEWSIVPVPCNPDAIAMHLSRGKVEGQPIPDSIKSILEPWKHQKKYIGFSDLVPPSPTIPPSKDLAEDLIAPPSHGSSEEKEEEEPVDPHKGWPEGAKYIHHLIDMGCQCKAYTEDCLTRMEQPRVIKLANRKLKHIEKECYRLSSIGHELYPTLIPEPEPLEEEEIVGEEEEEEKGQPLPTVEEKDESSISSEELLEVLQGVKAEFDSMKNTFFELTGKEV